MVGTNRGGLLAFLQRLGTHASATDVQELARRAGRGRRTLQRWLRAHDLTFYPSVRYEALGLVHLHAFIDQPTDRHLTFRTPGRLSGLVHSRGWRPSTCTASSRANNSGRYRNTSGA